ncbi:MAG: recombinase family protein [Silvibacterium sp.]|nr:recombinase family protein [Silvibacterium sp.]
MKRAALYLRVSTLNQHPETQLYDLHQMAQQRGFEIVEEYTDRVSGARARRPGLDALMRDARRGRFDTLLVWASDRIARSVKHFLKVLDELNRLNIEFIQLPRADRYRRATGQGNRGQHRSDCGARAQPDRRAGAGWHAPRPARGPAHRV